MFGSQDLFVLLAIGVFFFGAKRLPELSRSLGQAISEFKKGVSSGSPDAAAPEAKPEAPLPPAKDAGRDGG
jgi:sec-independent protein translocase protein TatA